MDARTRYIHQLLTEYDENHGLVAHSGYSGPVDERDGYYGTPAPEQPEGCACPNCGCWCVCEPRKEPHR